MTIYYVDSNAGSDANNGLTPGFAFATIQHAHDGTNPGDTVYILPGKGYGGGTGNTSPLCVSRGGSAGNPIIYSNYPGMPMPVIQQPSGTSCGQVIQLGASGGVFSSILPFGYVTFNGLEIVGQLQALTYQNAWNDAGAGTFTQQYSTSGVASTGNEITTMTAGTATGTTTLNLGSNPTTVGVRAGDVVIDATNSSRIPVGTTVVSVGTTSIVLTAAQSCVSSDTINIFHPYHHLIFQNCKIHDFTADALTLITMDYITVSGCLIYNCAWYSANAASGVSLYNPIDIDTNTSTYKNVISGNIIYNCRELLPWVRNQTPVSLTANGTTNSGNNVLHFASTGAVAAPMGVFDTTSAHGGFIPAGTVVVSTTGTTVTLNNNVTSTLNSGETFKFFTWSDGEGLIIDDTLGDQYSKQAYAGKTLVTNNLTVLNGSSGLQAFNSTNVDMTFNTSYLDMDSVPLVGLDGNISYVGSSTTTGNCYNNISVANAGNAAVKNFSGTTVTFSNNLSFGNATALPGSNNKTNVDPLFVSPTSLSSFFSAISTLPPAITNFQLSPGSPAIDAASGLFTRTTDFLGNPGQFGNVASDMGAYESPNSTWGGNTIQSMSTIITELANNSSGLITAAILRNTVISLWAGRSPWTK